MSWNAPEPVAPVVVEPVALGVVLAALGVAPAAQVVLVAPVVVAPAALVVVEPAARVVEPAALADLVPGDLVPAAPMVRREVRARVGPGRVPARQEARRLRLAAVPPGWARLVRPRTQLPPRRNLDLPQWAASASALPARLPWAAEGATESHRRKRRSKRPNVVVT